MWSSRQRSGRLPRTQDKNKVFFVFGAEAACSQVAAAQKININRRGDSIRSKQGWEIVQPDGAGDNGKSMSGKSMSGKSMSSRNGR